MLFVEVNGCPARLRTAETAEFYTTLAEITAEEFDGRENAVIAKLGDSFVELLFDLFILPGGPRLRDKVIWRPSLSFDPPTSKISQFSSRSATERLILKTKTITKSGAMLWVSINDR